MANGSGEPSATALVGMEGFVLKSQVVRDGEHWLLVQTWSRHYRFTFTSPGCAHFAGLVDVGGAYEELLIGPSFVGARMRSEERPPDCGRS